LKSICYQQLLKTTKKTNSLNAEKQTIKFHKSCQKLNLTVETKKINKYPNIVFILVSLVDTFYIFTKAKSVGC